VQSCKVVKITPKYSHPCPFQLQSVLWKYEDDTSAEVNCISLVAVDCTTKLEEAHAFLQSSYLAPTPPFPPLRYHKAFLPLSKYFFSLVACHCTYTIQLMGEEVKVKKTTAQKPRNSNSQEANNFVVLSL
jgi:hypothetical protein